MKNSDSVIQPVGAVNWIDWQQGGGHRVYEGTRNLGSAILQGSKTDYRLTQEQERS